MNKLLLSAAVFGCVIGAQAKMSAPTNTVLEIMTFQDDTPVVLRGKIDQHLGHGKYQFSDPTGTIILDIDDEVLGNTEIMTAEMVEVHGEVDKGWFSTEVDVEEIITK